MSAAVPDRRPLGSSRPQPRPAAGADLSCLWLARCDPFPMDSGDNMYTGMLVEALAAAGVTVTFVGLRRSRTGDGWGGSGAAVRFHPVPGSPNPLWRAVLSRRPQVAAKFRTRSYRRELERLLTERRWDAIVIDQYGMGWTLEAIERAFAGDATRPVVVHVAHDHEATLTRDIARNSTADPLTRLMLHLNAWKTAVAEGGLVERCDLLTAITPEDRDRFLAAAPGKPHVVLTPGYAGPRIAGREITADVPRRAVILGSFTWTAKVMNLREFLAVADPLFAAAGAELRVVGTVDPRVAEALRPGLHATRLTGYVADPTPELLGARIGIVPERTGGGFKLKLLDYLFHGLPIAAVAHATAGWPAEMADALLRYDDLPSLARGVVEALDDLPRLNALQRRALAGGAAFAWPDRGTALRHAIEERLRARIGAAAAHP
jgi:polysaccharide biosynthesis protein PslH